MVRCSELTATCTVENSIYGYFPNLAANVFFTVAFAILGLTQAVLFMRWKTWSYGAVVTIGCVLEMIGYIGRVLMHHNPYGASLAIQISLLIIAPTFFSAGLYLTLKHIILAVEPRLSLLRPQMYTWIFISADIVSLLLQASGGGIESTASSSGDPDRLTIGNDMMMAGIIFQVVTLTIFFLLAAHFFWRVFSHGGKQNSSPDVSILSDRKFLFFISAMTVTFTTIYVRCVYRIIEMAGGWRNPVMQDEVAFIVLEGVMILIAAIAFDLAHPGYFFPPMRSGHRIISADHDQMVDLDERPSTTVA